MNSKYEIGPFRLDAAAGLLTRSGVPVALGPRGVAVLAALVRHPNEYVQKADIFDAAWPDVVVEEANLTVQISAIRRALAQAPGGESWVETLSRRGYRFVGPVTELTSKLARGADGKNSNLPEAMTSFVGRERELVEIKRLLPHTRLLTLVGVGGIGKTRLALQAGAEVLDAYRDGVWLVELASVADPGLVPQSVVALLGLKEERGKSLTQTLIECLASRHMLLVLDNAEHLLAACAQLADAVLRQCPYVVMMATSREKLGMAGEQTYPVPPLSMPDPERYATAESLAQYESAQLFIERARLNLPHFAVTNENAPALASVCCRLDGIPLAIELAAARVRSMSVEEVNQRLDQRFRLLTGGSPMAPHRHQTLRALIDWSYDLLSDAEKALLCRVSVFAGGWTPEAAEQVCGGEGIDDWEALDLLTSLADKNLVLADEQNGATRYRLLETVRQYARDMLRESGEEARCQGRHLAYFSSVAEEAEPQLTGAEQQIWLNRLETEHDNLRAALGWSVAAGGDAVGGLRLAGALRWFWDTRCYFGEGRGWLSALLSAAPGEKAAASRAKALHVAGVLAWQQGDYPAALPQLEQSLAIWRDLGDRRGIAFSLHNLGNIAVDQCNYVAARALYEESLALRQGLGDRWGVASSLHVLGNLAYEQGDYPTALALDAESLTIHRELRDQLGTSVTLDNLGNVAYEQRDYPAARAFFEESLAIRRELGDRSGIGLSLTFLGAVAFAQGNYASARALLEESLALGRVLGEGGLSIAQRFEGLAYVASAVARPGRAARIWGRAERLREEASTPLPLRERLRYDHQVAAARAALGDDAAFDLAWQEGRAMSLHQAIEYALEKHDA